MNECVIVMLFLEIFLNVLVHSHPPPLTGHRAGGATGGWLGGMARPGRGDTHTYHCYLHAETK